MESALPKTSWGVTIVVILALLQGVAGVVHALRWFDIGSNLLGQGLLLFPIVGVIALFRGAFVAAVGLLYVLFGCGVFLHRAWAWWVGSVVAVVNLLLVVSAIAQGGSLDRGLLWSVVPLTILIYVFSTSGRQMLRGK